MDPHSRPNRLTDVATYLLPLVEAFALPGIPESINRQAQHGIERAVGHIIGDLIRHADEKVHPLRSMTGGIVIFERVIVNVRVAIQALRVGWIGYNGIRTDEYAQFRVAHPGAHVVQLNVIVAPLTGELPVGRHRATARLAIRVIAHVAHFATGAAGGDRCAAQVITEEQDRKAIYLDINRNCSGDCQNCTMANHIG